MTCIVGPYEPRCGPKRARSADEYDSKAFGNVARQEQDGRHLRIIRLLLRILARRLHAAKCVAQRFCLSLSGPPLPPPRGATVDLSDGFLRFAYAFGTHLFRFAPTPPESPNAAPTRP